MNTNKEPLSACLIKYFVGETERTVLTRENGIAEIRMSPGECKKKIPFEFSFVGYKTLKTALSCPTDTIIVLTEADNFTEEVCITGEYSPMPVSQSVYKVKILSREMVMNSGAFSLAELLAYQTGIRIQQDNVLGSGLELNGMSGQNVKILIDGVPVIGRLGGNIDLSQLNLENVERIEIINGPLSVNYGTNALAGTINIITRKNFKEGFSGNLLTFYESVGNYNLTGNFVYKKNTHSWKLSGGRKFFDGWNPNDKFISFPRKTLADTNRALLWNPKLQYFGELQYLFTPENWIVNPYIRYYYEKITNRGFPMKPYYEKAFDDYFYTFRTDYGISLSKYFSAGHWKTLANYNLYKRIKNTYLTDLTTLEKTLSRETGAQDTSIFDLLMLRSVFSSDLNKTFDFQIGLDLNRESSYGKRIKNNKQTIGDYALFVTTRWELFKKQIVLKPGLRYAYNTRYKSPIIPSLNIKWTLRNWTLKASAAKGFRAPTLKELFLYFVDINHNIQGNPELKAENSLNYLTSVEWKKRMKQGNLKSSLSFFYNDFSDLITLAVVENNKYSYINLGQYHTLGIQGEILRSYKNITISLTPSYIARENIVFYQIPQVRRFFFSPELGATLNWNFGKKKWSLNVYYKYNGTLLQYILDDEELKVSKIQDYSILDASIKRILIPKKLEIIFGAKNLFNIKNIPVTGANPSGIHASAGTRAVGRGTSLFFSLNYKFDTERK